MLSPARLHCITIRPRRLALLLILAGSAVLLPACGGGTAYVAPAGGADWTALGVQLEEDPEYANATPAERKEMERRIREDQTDASIARSFDLRPLASFPVGLATVRIQAPGYNQNRRGYGHNDGSRFCVVDDREVETAEHLTTLESLPHVHGVAPLNRLILPTNLRSHDELRRGAAAVRAEMLLIYTLDTRFYKEDRDDPMELVTLGLWSNDRSHWVCNASAVLMDTRNGYLYGLASGHAEDSRPMSAWKNFDVVDAARKDVEREAFDELVRNFCTDWRRVIAAYGPKPEEAPGPAVTATSTVASPDSAEGG